MTNVNSNEPIELKTTNGHTVMLRPFVPPRMTNETRGVFLRYAKMNPKITKGKMTDTDAGEEIQFKDGIPAEIINEINEITLRRMVISVDNISGDGVMDHILDNLRQVDYTEIITKCNEISTETSIDDEKKST